jgi:phosphate-selective porin OprO/OprP
MSNTRTILSCAVSIAAVVAAAGPAMAQSAEQVDKLEARIKAMQQELQQLKGQVKKSQKAAEQAYAADVAAAPVKAPVAPPSAIVKMSAGNRPSICTPDGLNCIAITSRLHFDAGGYSYSPNTAGTAAQHLDSGVNARRARIGVLGTFQGDWNYALVYDFGGTSDGLGGTVGSTGGVTTALLPGGATSGIENAYLSYQGFKPFGGQAALEGGYMDVMYTLDEATSSNDIMFMERASPGIVASNIAAGDFRSAAGGRWYDDRFWFGAYATGPLSGAVHSGTPTSAIAATAVTEQYGGVARAAVQVVSGKDASGRDYSLHLGADAEALFKPSINRVTGAETLTLSDRPELRIDPTTLLTTGAIASVQNAQVYSAEAAASYGPFYAQGEYFWYNVDRIGALSSLKFQGGYVEASLMLTGESHTYNPGNAAYNGIVPANPFWFSHGGWGAWEIAARYSTVDLNDRLGFADGVAGGKQTVYTAGLNWYATRNIRFMLNYLHGIVDKQASAVSTADVGAKFDAVAVRTQVAF